jgi:hypothetical protein
MPTLAEIERIEAEIAKLRSDLEDCTDTQIQEVIQTRIKELRRKLAQFQSSRRGSGRDRAGTRPRPGSPSIIFAERGFVPSTVAQLKGLSFVTKSEHDCPQRTLAWSGDAIHNYVVNAACSRNFTDHAERSCGWRQTAR